MGPVIKMKDKNNPSHHHATRISFDLDEVLFVDPDSVETEPPLPYPFSFIFKERLRKGTVRLIHELQKEGFQVWVYTSSFRSERYIRGLFRLYHIQMDEIVNMPRHLREVQKSHVHSLPQKLPNHYRISLHIDDEDVIHQYGRQLGFRTFKVYEQDDQWVEKVLAEAKRVREIEHQMKN